MSRLTLKFLGFAFITLFCLSSSLDAQSSGHWKFARLEGPDSSKQPGFFSGDAGAVIVSDSKLLNPATGETHSMSASFIWEAPPATLIPESRLELPIRVTLLKNSHPNGGRAMAGNLTPFWGWNQGGAGSNCFKNAQGLYMAGFETSDRQQGDQSVLWAMPKQREVVLKGSYEIPAGNKVDFPLENDVAVCPIIVNIVYANTPHTFKYVYTWHPEAAPAQPEIAGVWQHGSNGETWTITRQHDGTYSAVEKGFDNASGTATISDNKFRIEYTTPRGVSGEYEVVLEPDGRSGKGTWTSDLPDSGTRTFTKTSSAPPSQPTPTNETTTPEDPIGFAVRVTEHRLKPGETARIPVEIIQPDNVSNLNIVLEFDPAVAKVDSKPTIDKAAGQRLFETNISEPGLVRLGFAGSTGIKSEGVIATIPFTAVGAVGGRTPIRVQVTQANRVDGQELEPQQIPGSIEIVAAGDGDSGTNPPPVVTPPKKPLTTDDALRALKMSVKSLPEELALDVDANGEVTSNDARLILKQAVGNK